MQLTERHVPGVAVAVIRNGRVVKMKGYGLASVEFNAPVTTETVFEIGSVTIQFTAAGIPLLAEEGMLSVDDRIEKFPPDIPAAWTNITIRILFSETEGEPTPRRRFVGRSKKCDAVSARRGRRVHPTATRRRCYRGHSQSGNRAPRVIGGD